MTDSEPHVTIVDYKAGNLTSVRLAVEKLGWDASVTGDPEHVRAAERLIFPGVGAAPSAMQTLKATGLAEAMAEYASSGRPMAGICLGAQIIFERSAEGDAACLGILPGSVDPLEVGPDLKVPHMGWNAVEFTREHAVWAGLETGAQFYFVHSFAAVPESEGLVIGRTEYDQSFVSAVARENIVAFQFHPERSGRLGLKVLENFLTWTP